MARRSSFNTSSFLFNTNLIFNPIILDKVIDSFNVQTESYQPKPQTYCNLYVVMDLIYAYGGGMVPFPNVEILTGEILDWLKGVKYLSRTRFSKISDSFISYQEIVEKQEDGKEIKRTEVYAGENGWREISIDEGHAAASNGSIVVISGPKHISMVRPTDEGGQYRHTQAGANNVQNGVVNEKSAEGWGSSYNSAKYFRWSKS